MKKTDSVLLLALLCAAAALIIFSPEARAGAAKGIILAQNSIIPSLLPLLIIFFLIVKTGAKDVLARCSGRICPLVFNLPPVAFPVVFFGLAGGYPTGALLTEELFNSGEIDENQAQRMLRFNFCGGCGFIITAVGSAILGDEKAGVILFFSNVISSVIIGFALSFCEKRKKYEFYSFTPEKNFGDCLADSVKGAVSAVLTITAYIALFSALMQICPIDGRVLPIFEITNGVSQIKNASLTAVSAFLSFGGFCIHFQLLGSIKKVKMRYLDFLIFRVIGALLSGTAAKVILLIFPRETAVFSNSAGSVFQLSSVNFTLSALLIIGCFVMIFDINSKRNILSQRQI